MKTLHSVLIAFLIFSIFTLSSPKNIVETSETPTEQVLEEKSSEKKISEKFFQTFHSAQFFNEYRCDSSIYKDSLYFFHYQTSLLRPPNYS